MKGGHDQSISHDQSSTEETNRFYIIILFPQIKKAKQKKPKKKNQKVLSLLSVWAKF